MNENEVLIDEIRRLTEEMRRHHDKKEKYDRIRNYLLIVIAVALFLITVLIT